MLVVVFPQNLGPTTSTAPAECNARSMSFSAYLLIYSIMVFIVFRVQSYKNEIKFPRFAMNNSQDLQWITENQGTTGTRSHGDRFIDPLLVLLYSGKLRKRRSSLLHLHSNLSKQYTTVKEIISKRTRNSHFLQERWRLEKR